MSVTVAVTVTLPNWTAAGIVATGLQINDSIGNEVIRLVKAQCVAGPALDPGAVTAATVVT
jgi:hypothetical protein